MGSFDGGTSSKAPGDYNGLDADHMPTFTAIPPQHHGTRLDVVSIS
jgi:hypothetical protein